MKIYLIRNKTTGLWWDDRIEMWTAILDATVYDEFMTTWEYGPQLLEDEEWVVFIEVAGDA